ncbi:VCBS repeat-containing protein [Xanthocytophaga flava]|uniref:VCBS repeat-containing protein n=1 Tax=Xanthocytophaga flava TaxID=3048013 RepID=UPI0028D8CC24|nr:VCBS repeat-containing protein [Xanthocytophaga flavus]MDJ1473201.1 VCBS repeat-containing protein [Xanthocytophaga flavus]
MKALHYIFVLLCVSFLACQKQKKSALFIQQNSQHTGITFANQLTETEALNILNYEYFYNGGGVAAGDFNNDGNIDLYFTGNMVDNILYLNTGNLQFKDITQAAGVTGRKGGWKTGVSLVDINSDGWLDIYVCYSGNLGLEQRRNQLFVNNGNLTFTEKAQEYGLDDSGYTTQAAFLDYDLDGDLDCFILNHNLRSYERNPDASVMRNKRDDYAGDKLFKNENGKFTEVTTEAGIKSNPLGFGLGLAISDVNKDGRPDIYVGNDYVEDDYLYINQGDGTFKDMLQETLDHTSRFTMGVDIADINNDSRPDIFTLDMLPEDNLRQKLLAFPDNWNNYQSMLANGFWHQNMRNMLHLNQTVNISSYNSVGKVSYSEIGQSAGISNTDWSWAALFADFDNDGWKDLFVTNGEVKDFTNSDFIKYTADEEMKASAGQPHESLMEQIHKMPSSPTHSYIFRNNANLTFTDESVKWGFEKPTIANGAVYVDLDNDGDLDIVTNNNNEQARIYKNTSRDINEENSSDANQPNKQAESSFLKIKIKGPKQNPFGVHTKVYVTSDSLTQYQEVSPVKGFQSSMFDVLHFGLGTNHNPVKIHVEWPDGKWKDSTITVVNKTIEISYDLYAFQRIVHTSIDNSLFQETPDILHYTHKENYANDFARQILLPYQYSYSGARIAKGDINKDGLMDLYLGGARNQVGKIFLQQKSGLFSEIRTDAFVQDSIYEDKDAVFFDADGDKDLDLYVVSGDFSQRKNTMMQQDRLYINDGTCHFLQSKTALPAETANGSCVKVLDIDNDKDLDLFIGGTATPNEFPAADASFILLNNGKGSFTSVPLSHFKLGLVSDAFVMDMNKDGFSEIIIVGEWMSPKVLSFKNGQATVQDLQIRDARSEQQWLNGWWNRIAGDDLDGDGDLDLVLGNLGNNCQMKPSVTYPMRMYAGDFDKNGIIDPVVSYYIQQKQYPAISRDELLEQIVSLRRKYTNYQSYAEATLEDVFSEGELNNAMTYRIDFTESCVLENTPHGFVLHSLPSQAQYAPVYAIAIEDINKDGKKDLLLSGNNSYYHLRIGKMDANHGFVFLNKGNFQFDYVSQSLSGLNVKGDVKDVQVINNSTWIFFVNNAPVQVYQQKDVRPL